MKNCLSKSQIERFSRQLVLKNIGAKGQKKILSSKILIVGVGGLGCPAAENLVRAGIGTIGLIDRDVVNFALQLPVNNKYRYSTKWILKQVAKKYLPNKIINRKKTGFGVPLRHWMQNDFNEIVNETLSKSSIDKRGIFNYYGINQMRKNNNVDFTYTLFSIVCFELWCRTFIDK